MSSESITTERLVLRPLKVEDAQEILAINAFKEVREQLLQSSLTSLEQAFEWIKSVTSSSKSLIYSISLPGNPQIIGLVGLNASGRLLYYLHPSAWGKDYATEAVLTFQKVLFEKQPERSILVAGVHDGNEASLKIIKKAGFKETKDWRGDHPVGRRMSSVETTGLRSAVRELAQSGLQSKSPIADEIAAEESKFTWYRYEKPRETVDE
ncbi:acyl-CoA N-acyltransferase [Tothia fuscella]|uniref:Acyl-CoA N-acyltransferase n=1 Tax=Tothia fuscella TaxID=1048955 RepID=A0A9P4NFQ6_9PEZI|nr:acyl-CoA N-acyltransferase [Tothia fuscella]